MTTVGGWLAAHSELDRRDREVLLCRAARLTRAQVLAGPEREIGQPVWELLEVWARRRRTGEPMAYILGEREFWGLDLRVSPAVLVPRPETELLVQAGLEVLAARRGPSEASDDGFTSRGRASLTPHRDQRLLDLGTGSGAVAVALAVEARARGLGLAVSATDISPAALEVAQANARRHHVEIVWHRSDWFSAVPGHYDVIVSNPPYVAENDPHLAGLGNEPRLALVAGTDGLDAIRAITAAAPAHLCPGGALLLEHGHDQGVAVRKLLADAGLARVETLRDLAGHERVSRAYMLRRCR